MADYHYLYSADYEQKTGGWVYNQHVVDWLRRSGAAVEIYTVPIAFPAPSEATVAAVDAMLDRLEPGTVLLTDHIYACMFAPILRGRPLRVVSIFHHSLAEEHADGGTFRAVEQAAIDLSETVVVTSQETRDYIARHYAASGDRIVVALPGVDPQPASAPHKGGPWRFLSVGAVIPRKRYELMIAALALVGDIDWSLTIAGNTARYPDYVAGLQTTIAEAGMADRIRFAGELPERALQMHWRETHLYLASSAYEGYGMAISEALVRAIPVVTTASGAVASWAGEGASLVRSDAPQAFAEALVPILAQPALYAEARRRAASFGSRLASWDESLAVIGPRLSRSTA
jgi:glycosyltransferase involved in cell wall biosynthesis